MNFACDMEVGDVYECQRNWHAYATFAYWHSVYNNGKYEIFNQIDFLFKFISTHTRKFMLKLHGNGVLYTIYLTGITPHNTHEIWILMKNRQ